MRLRGAFPAALALTALSAFAAGEPLRPYAVRDDAIDQPLTGRPGDPARGQALIADRQRSLCLLCHAGPFPDPHMQGTLGPDLRGAGSRLSEGQLRLRVVDMKRVEPSTVMPAYYRVDGLERVADVWRDEPVLTAAEIEDVVAYLVTLRDR